MPGTGPQFLAGMSTGDEVLVVHLGGLGDVCLSESVFLSLRRHFGDRLVALGNDENDRGLLWAADRAYLVGTGLRDLDAAPHVRRVTAAPSAVTAVLRDLTAPSGRLTSAR